MYQIEPILNENVKIFRKEKSICFSMPYDEFEIEFEDSSLLNFSFDFLNELPASFFIDRSEKEEEHIDQLISLLDSQSVLTCNKEISYNHKTGIQFINEIEFFYRKLILNKNGVDRVTSLIKSKKIETEQLKRWLDQYKIVTSLAESVLVTSLSNSDVNPDLYHSLFDFYKDEIGHDKLVANDSGNDVINQYEGVHIAFVALMSLMKQYARYDLYSFVSYIMILEGKSQDSQDFIELLDSSSLPDRLIQGHIKHENINIKANHEDEARQISSKLPLVTQKKFNEVKDNIKKHYDIRMYANDYIIEGKYHGGKLLSDILITLKDNISLLMKHSMPEAISNSSLKLKSDLTKIFMTMRWDKSFKVNDSDRVIFEIYKESLWLLANSNPSDYYEIMLFLTDENYSVRPNVSSSIAKIIVDSWGFDA